MDKEDTTKSGFNRIVALIRIVGWNLNQSNSLDGSKKSNTEKKKPQGTQRILVLQMNWNLKAKELNDVRGSIWVSFNLIPYTKKNKINELIFSVSSSCDFSLPPPQVSSWSLHPKRPLTALTSPWKPIKNKIKFNTPFIKQR